MESRVSDSMEESYPNWLQLPRDVISSIFMKLTPFEIFWSVENVCSLWKEISKEPSMWRSVNMFHFDDDDDLEECDLEKVAKLAVDRSCGQLESIGILSFGSQSLLKYIADRGRNLKCLRLGMCSGIRESEFIEQVNKLEGLEEVELSYCMFTEEAVRALGRSCRRLKSLKLNNEVRRVEYSDDDAMAIAENMPGLEELQVVGNGLTNAGLLAILDGCTRLRSLDLRLCIFVNFEGEVEKRCSERLTLIRRPRDSTDDYMFNRWVDDFSAFDIDCSTDGDDYDDYYDDFIDFDDYEFGDYEEYGLRYGNNDYHFGFGDEDFPDHVGLEFEFGDFL